MKELPVWLLDVDGVLNAVGKPGWSAQPRRKVVAVDGVEYRLRWAPALIDEVWKIATSGSVEVQWATTWAGNTDVVERVLGLPHLLSAFLLNGCKEEAQNLKRKAALSVVRSSRRLVWTDDDAIWSSGTEREDLEDSGALLISPDSRHGLQREDIASIRAWLDTC